MLKSIGQNKIAAIVLSGAFLFFVCLVVFSEATYDPGDGIRHYLVSRYCWQHHDLLLYSWGKPFFTVVSSPFSQFGLIGINIFNIFCGAGSAWFAYRIAVQLKITNALLAIPFLLFAPCYFPTMNSGLTEPFFGFILIFSICMMISERYVLACIIVSFLPFVRTEGNLLLPLFFIVMIYRGQYLKSLLLGSGTLVYSVIGYFYFDDFFWVKNQNPYNGENRAFYGSGELLHFVTSYNFIWGTALTLLFVAGIAMFFRNASDVLRSKTLRSGKLPEEALLIYGSFVLYFIAHSIMWWKGLANSLGLLRVIAGVMPCSALICLRGLSAINIRLIRERKIVRWAVIALVLFWVIRSPFKHDYFPFRLDREQALVKEAGEWFKSSPYKCKKVYYLYPYLAHVLEVDSFDPNKVGELWGLYPSIRQWGIGSIPDSTVVFWDAHFGPNECKIPLDTIMSDPNFQLIKTFKPAEEFTTLGNYKFEIYAFLKLPKPREMRELATLNFDLESDSGLFSTQCITEKKSASGKKSCEMNASNEYSATIRILYKDIPENSKAVRLNAKIFSEKKLNAQVVFSFDDPVSGKNFLWKGLPITTPASANEEWKESSSLLAMPADPLPENTVLSIYIWNKPKESFFIDDLELSYLSY